MRIAITGASGFIGEALVPALVAAGHQVVALTRSAATARAVFPAAREPDVTIVEYTPLRVGPWAAALEGCDAVVNLAGSSITGRWTPARRREMRDSRISATRTLVEAIAAARDRPRALVSASANRFYGISEDATFDEDTPPQPGDLLTLICEGWEAEARRAEALGLRVAILRFGVVLDMTPTFRGLIPRFGRFLGGRVGSGRQWFSWLHRDDAVAIVMAALQGEAMAGPYNAASPQPVRMDDFTGAMGDMVGASLRVPAPTFVLQTLLGDAAVVFLQGQKLEPRRLREAGYAFRHPALRGALEAVFAKAPG